MYRWDRLAYTSNNVMDAVNKTTFWVLKIVRGPTWKKSDLELRK